MAAPILERETNARLRWSQGGISMKYQIEYSDGKCTFVNGRNGLLKRLNLPGNETSHGYQKTV